MGFSMTEVLDFFIALAFLIDKAKGFIDSAVHSHSINTRDGDTIISKAPFNCAIVMIFSEDKQRPHLVKQATGRFFFFFHFLFAITGFLHTPSLLFVLTLLLIQG